MADSKTPEKTTTQNSTSSTPSTGSSSSSTRAKDQAEPTTERLAVDANEPGIDPRLDNRTGDQRPKLEEFPAKPQQIDGPELGQERAVAARAEREREDVGRRKGAKSPGPHGLGDTADQV
ncbi:hypothetical protein ACF09G_13140 [Streptomyces albogriseolus]|uniref:hypothetical protein n=1 Tax=Streptomyces albogriseolus TaxID=1887 RepID=UPI00225482AA|nr:hypothetical protein [Streptomyces viridodiastaticus]MCX4622787.1 hypothetical protein [Streptomyces viridodiastaticus]